MDLPKGEATDDVRQMVSELLDADDALGGSVLADLGGLLFSDASDMEAWVVTLVMFTAATDEVGVGLRSVSVVVGKESSSTTTLALEVDDAAGAVAVMPMADS